MYEVLHLFVAYDYDESVVAEPASQSTVAAARRRATPPP